MRRADLRRSELAAVSLLSRQAFRSIYDLAHLDVRRLSLPIAVTFDSFASYCEKTKTAREALPPSLPDGMTVRYGGQYLVLYREAPARRLAFTLAHELGHILLGHAGESPTAEEREANAFAASLLCPAAAVGYLVHRRERLLTAEELTAIFPLSHEAAECRLSELAHRTPRPPTDEEITLLLHLFGKFSVAAE